jgi:hypothetical protein
LPNWYLQGTLRNCPKAKVESSVVATEQVHFFNNYYQEFENEIIAELSIFPYPQSNAAVSPSGIDNKELVVPNPENITASHGEV